MHGYPIHTHETNVRTNIENIDELMESALSAGNFKTNKAVVEAGLRLLVQTRAQGRIRVLHGKLRWEGSLDEMRRDN